MLDFRKIIEELVRSDAFNCFHPDFVSAFFVVRFTP